MRKLRNFMANSSNNRISYMIRRLAFKLYNTVAKDCGEWLFQKRSGNLYYGITLDYMKSPFLHKHIGEFVKKDLQFPYPSDAANINFLKLVSNCNSVAIHVRRTDYLKFNEDCYEFGYFMRAVRYIKKKVKNPIFFIFSDDLDWCKNNYSTLGITSVDIVYYVGINCNKDSYKDMQIMSNCKNVIATKSSFGWWASYLNKNPNKITCCQISSYIVTNQF